MLAAAGTHSHPYQLGEPSSSRPLRASPLPSKSDRRPWTAEEDLALSGAVQKFGSCTGQGSNWSKISGIVGGGRTNKDCRKRWFYTLDPNLRKGRWTWEEDATLRLAYAEVGPQWREIASRIPGRNDEQVAKRWKDVLAPDLVLDAPWTTEEDLLLLKLFKELGPKWTPMSDHFPGRNGIACRNRFRKFKLRPSTVAQPSAAATTEDNYGQDMYNVSSTLGIHGQETNTINSGHGLSSGEITDHIDFTNIHSIFQLNENEPEINGFSIPPLDQIIDHHPQPISFPPLLSISHDQVQVQVQNDQITSVPTPTPSQNNTILQQWLDATFGDGDGDGDEEDEQWLTSMDLSSGVGVGAGMDMGFPFGTAIETNTDTNTNTESDSPTQPLLTTSSTGMEPIANAWGLLVALESGSETLTLTAALVRQLLADASRT